MVAVGYILTAAVAYLLGSIPTGFLVARARGVDIRTVGSGNIGATNVFRYLGKWAGAAVLIIDGLKGWVAVGLVARVSADWFLPPDSVYGPQWHAILAGLFAVLGHNYTCWLKFKGGKGIATSAGVLLGLVPGPLLMILAVWVLVFALSRYVSLASISASFSLPFACWITNRGLTLILITAGLALLAIYKHKGNIRRLIKGTESRIGKGAPEPQK